MLVTIVVIVLIVAVLNFRSFKKITSVIRAQIGKFGNFVVGFDPVSIYQQKIDDGISQIESAKRSLENVQAQILSLKRQIKNGQTEQSRLSSRIKDSISKGITPTDYAKQLITVEENLDTNNEQLVRTQEIYDSFVVAIKSNVDKINEYRRKAKDLNMRLEQSEKEAELVKISTSLSNSVKFGFDDSLAKVEEQILQKIDRNMAVSRVVLDDSKDDFVEENNFKVNEILSRFQTK